MIQYIESHGLKIAEPLFKLLNDRIAPGANVEPDSFWKSLSTILSDLTLVNLALLEKRVIGCAQANGYTEPVLHARREAKAKG